MKILPTILAWCAGAAALALGQPNNPIVSGSLATADVAALRNVNDKYRQTCLAKAWPEWARLFTADGMILPPNGPAVTGLAGIEAWGRAFPSFTGFQNPIAEIDGAGGSAVMRGTYELTFSPTQKDTGKWICVMRKQPDGSWKFRRCMFNSDMPAAAATTTSAPSAAAHDALLSGTWELNLARSRFNPGPAPRSETRTYSMLPDGRQHAIYDQVDASGKRTRSESTFTFDGKDSPIVGDMHEDTQAITRTGPRTISAVIKKAGRVVRTATREVSADGRSLTLHFKGLNPEGRPLDDVWVFDRKDDDVATR